MQNNYYTVWLLLEVAKIIHPWRGTFIRSQKLRSNKASQCGQTLEQIDKELKQGEVRQGRRVFISFSQGHRQTQETSYIGPTGNLLSPKDSQSANHIYIPLFSTSSQSSLKAAAAK